MKKALIILISIICISSASFAQKYERAAEIPFGIGPDDYEKAYFGIDVVYGVHLNDYFSFGAGLGIRYLSGIVSYTNGSPNSETSYVIPALGRLKVNFTKGKYSPFFLFNAGYYLDFINNDNNTTNLFYEPMFGVDIEKRFRFALGVNLQKAEYSKIVTWGNSFASGGYGERIEGCASVICLRVGFMF